MIPFTAKALRQKEDLPVITLYSDRHILTQAIIPGINTLRKFPNMRGHDIILKKQYLTPDAPPLKRGEPPEREFKTAMEVKRRVPNLKIPTPLGHTATTFYGEFIPGKELTLTSPIPQNIKDYLKPAPRRPAGGKPTSTA